MVVRAYVSFAVSMAALSLACGCQRSEEPSADAPVRVRVGPVLGDAVRELSDKFMETHPGMRVAPDASCPLCVLEVSDASEAPFDVVVSIGASDIDRFVEAHYVAPETLEEIGQTELVIVVPQDSELNIRSIEDLASPAVEEIHLADPDVISLGRTVEQALDTAGILQVVRPKLVSCRTGCEVLKTVALGQAEVGIVYAFCLAGEEETQVRLAAVVPPELHDPIPVVMALSPQAADKKAALAFRDFALCPMGRAVLDDFSISFGGACGPGGDDAPEDPDA